MFDIAKAQTVAGETPILDIEVLLMDEGRQWGEDLRAELSPQEAAQWTRCCVRRHLI